MRDYDRSYRYERDYPAGRMWRRAVYDASYRARPRPGAPYGAIPQPHGYDRGYGRDYYRGGESVPRGYRPPRYEREYSRAYRDLFGNPYGAEMGGMDLAYRETQGRTRSPGIGEGSIGGAGNLGTGGGFFHL